MLDGPAVGTACVSAPPVAVTTMPSPATSSGTSVRRATPPRPVTLGRLMSRSGHVAALRRRVGTELLVLPAAMLCVTDASRRVLMVRHDDGGVWAPPGGTIEPGEAPADAAVREGWEELGVVVEPTDLIGVFGGPGHEVRYDNGDRATYVTSVFLCRLAAGHPRPDGHEVHEVRYVGREEWPQLTVAPWAPRVLPDVFAWLDAGPDRRPIFASARWQPHAGHDERGGV